MHGQGRTAMPFNGLRWWLFLALFAAIVGSNRMATALPLTIDYPDTRSVLGPSEITNPGLDTPPGTQSNRDILASVTSDSNTLTMPLQRYRVPTEAVLLREVGLDAGTQVDAAVEQAMTWVTQSMSASARADFAQRCESQFPAMSKSMQLTTAGLACLPWAIERFNSVLSARREAKNTRPSGGGRLRSEADWRSSLRGVNFLDAFWRIDPQTNAELMAEAAVAQRIGQDCQYRGAMAAFIARAEAFFPDPIALTAIEKVYPAAFTCLEPDDDGFERTHLRTGLFRLMQGDATKAKQSLLLSAHAENPEEEFRSLFWLGVIEENVGLRAATNGQNEYWDLLRKRYPLTIHSVVAGHSLGQDPLSSAISSKEAMISRRVGVSWSEYNLAAFFLELLISRKEATHLTGFVKYAARIVDAPNPDALLFLSKCYDTAQAYKIAIGTLTRYFKETQSQGVTIETLNMFFPRAYTSQILDSAGVVDPVIVLSLIRQESAFDPFARSGADARGLMQLLPSTASKWLANSKQELFDPSANVRVGVKYMETLFKRYDGNVEHVLAAYNAGLKNLDRWRQRFSGANTLMFMDLIPFKETRTYVAIILRNAYWYGRLMAMQRDSLADTIVKKSNAARWRSVTVQNLLRLAWAQDGGVGRSRTALSQLYSLPINSLPAQSN
ncbi:lytic transglycosylase domain-containing protein [bacterium]|nr:lytic transglycosylase domain-containing protein [bacterium]